MSLDDLARRATAFEKSDTEVFQRRARTLQSLWREEMGYEIGEHRRGDKSRPLGSRLPMPWAKETLANYITPTIRDVVRAEVEDADRSKGKLYGKPRIYNDLLSSQPLCFNLFGELTRDLASASKLVAEMTQGRFTGVTAIDFEWSPGRSDDKYTGDRSAFDVFISCMSSAGGRAFIGIEVKYHESLRDKAGRHPPAL